MGHSMGAGGQIRGQHRDSRGNRGSRGGHGGRSGHRGGGLGTPGGGGAQGRPIRPLGPLVKAQKLLEEIKKAVRIRLYDNKMYKRIVVDQKCCKKYYENFIAITSYDMQYC